MVIGKICIAKLFSDTGSGRNLLNAPLLSFKDTNMLKIERRFYDDTIAIAQKSTQNHDSWQHWNLVFGNRHKFVTSRNVGVAVHK
jgi:hypothetical protein